ncbi:hypothetical protein HWV23_02700 [Natronomonas halophila]|uniref:hypothetical protein n=1 Tax=Natronomonas halophila TaxID=2747817 RepID=UPI0015B6F5DF|nr:hypothetical protein [Natronomonas halophila]QLD84609.1 hypothetical protein HWV23_02415 [Natronomonas halophila]QLD84665.1 hypothetical protein HWV23_02700 [Natronomonas halophila]
MGRGIIEAERFRTERLGLAALTSDPTDTQPGEAWLRTDLNGASGDDQIATLRFQTSSGITSLRVFATSGVRPDEAAVYRVFVGGEIGVVPVLPTENAQAPGVRIQHNGVKALGRRPVQSPAFANAIHHYPMHDGDGTVLPDYIGSADGDIQGPAWTFGTYQADYALEGDGSGDYVTFQGNLSTYGSTLNGEASFAFTIENVSSNEWGDHILGVRENPSSGERFTIRIGDGLLLRSGHLGVIFIDASGNRYIAETDTAVDDGSRYRIVFTKSSDSTADWTFYVNTTTSTNVQESGTLGTMNDFARALYLFAEHSDYGGYINAIVDNVVLNDAAATTTEIDDDYTQQLWT